MEDKRTALERIFEEVLFGHLPGIVLWYRKRSDTWQFMDSFVSTELSIKIGDLAEFDPDAPNPHLVHKAKVLDQLAALKLDQGAETYIPEGTNYFIVLSAKQKAQQTDKVSDFFKKDPKDIQADRKLRQQSVVHILQAILLFRQQVGR